LSRRDFKDNIVLPGEVVAILVPGASRSHDEAAAVVIEHDGAPTLVHGGRPNVKDKAIFGGNWFVDSEGGPVRLK
jgi:hypothetical protein